MKIDMKNHVTVCGAAFFLALSACGGGGGGSSTPAPTLTTPSPTPATTPAPTPSPTPISTWTLGQFDRSSTFKDFCETPRSGQNILGETFTDDQGTLTDEKMWLRSWNNETYLWYDEVTDRSTQTSLKPVEYFNNLKTFETLASGQPKDDFHFSQDTETYLQRVLSEAQSGYGAQFAFRSVTGRLDQLYVLYNEPNSPASEIVNGETQLRRGAIVQSIDGVSVDRASTDRLTQSELDIVFGALEPSANGETHTFTILDPGTITPRDITLTSADIVDAAVNRTEIINTSTGNVGYILLNTFGTFEAEAELADAFVDFSAQNVTDLVVDIRYNGGGFVDIASQLGYMIAGPSNISTDIFNNSRFNDKSGNLNPVTGRVNTPTPFHSATQGFSSLPFNTSLDTLNLPRVFVLGTSSTCSASESLINALRGIDVEVIYVGPERTCGKPFGFFAADNCGTTFFTIQMQAQNAKDFGEYQHGFAPTNLVSSDPFDDFAIKIPGCQIEDDTEHELGDTNEAMLQAALNYRDTGLCPSAPIAKASTSSKGSTNVPSSGKKYYATPEDEFVDNIMIANPRR